MARPARWVWARSSLHWRWARPRSSRRGATRRCSTSCTSSTRRASFRSRSARGRLRRSSWKRPGATASMRSIEALGPNAPVSTVLDSFNALRRGGKAINIGGVADPIPLEPFPLMCLQKSYIGSLWFTAAEGQDMAAMAHAGTLNLGVFEHERFHAGPGQRSAGCDRPARRWIHQRRDHALISQPARPHQTQENTMHIRRIVTGHDPTGKSVFVSDAAAPRTTEFKHVPGFVTSLLWETPPNASVPAVEGDPAVSARSGSRTPGGTNLMFITFPPDAVMMSPSFDPAAAGGGVHAGAAGPGREVRDGPPRHAHHRLRRLRCASRGRDYTSSSTMAPRRSSRRATWSSRTALGTLGATRATSRRPCCSSWSAPSARADSRSELRRRGGSLSVRLGAS